MRGLLLALALSLLVAVPVAAAGEVIQVDVLGIQAPVVPAQFYQLPSGAWTLTVPCWEAASAWEAGDNTVLFGHSYHPTCGGVFNKLHHAQPGQEISYEGQRWVITQVKPGVQPVESHWLLPTAEPQLTLITCWPAYSTQSRMVIVARPVAASTSLPGAILYGFL